MTIPTEQIKSFARLFRGRTNAFGTGAGRWVKEPVTLDLFHQHLVGNGVGLGIAPLMDDGNVWFGAIDLDEPDFETARLMSSLLPGTTWIESSRSGNAHIWAFFEEPIEAWVVRGIMREALAAAGKPNVEVFPKQDKLLPGMFGNYINLPYHGTSRPILRDDPEPIEDHWHPDLQAARERAAREYEVGEFLELACSSLNDPAEWRKRGRWLGIPSPEEREASDHRTFGTQPYLHMCAEHIIAHRDDNPVGEGHRAVVYFSLAKQLSNCSMFDHDESLALMALVNDASPDPIPPSELARILFNAERGQFTSTGCDDPLFAPYAHPDCPIAHPRS